MAGGLLAGAMTLGAGLSSGGLFAIWGALALAAALLIRKVHSADSFAARHSTLECHMESSVIREHKILPCTPQSHSVPSS